MISGIFHNHGVWVGNSRKGDERNPKGFFENLELKKSIREWTGGTNFQTCPEFKPGWKKIAESIIRSQGYEEGPWLYKHGATFHKIWDEFKPNWIKIKRNPDAIFKSLRKARLLNRFGDSELKEIIKFHHDIMDTLPGITIYPEDLINGDYTNLKKAFTYCDLAFDENIADDFINKEYWHFS